MSGRFANAGSFDSGVDQGLDLNLGIAPPPDDHDSGTNSFQLPWDEDVPHERRHLVITIHLSIM